jgi:hypothetical protein
VVSSAEPGFRARRRLAEHDCAPIRGRLPVNPRRVDVILAKLCWYRAAMNDEPGLDGGALSRR